MDAILRDLRNRGMGKLMLGALRFFTPQERFYEALEPYRHLRIIDAGTGLGLLPDEAQARGFNMLGIDLAARQGQSENVLRFEAESFPYDASTWLMMCRPDHSGWAYGTLDIALVRGAGAFYVGLERNFERDLGEYVDRVVQRWDDVGEEGEHMLLFLPD
jgi:hypothetical protein